MNWWTRSTGLALSAFMGVLSVSANDSPSNSAVKLPIIDVTDRVFVPIAADKEFSHAWVGQIVEDSHGVLMVRHSRDLLVRYDGYQIRRYSPRFRWRQRSVCPKNVAASALSADRSGKIWIGASDSVYRYDSQNEQFTTLPIAPEKLQGLVRGINQDRAGTMWLATSRGLTRYKPENGEAAQLVHKEGDRTTLGSNFVRATLETKDGTFWVATNSTLDIFDRQIGRVTQHFLLRNPLQKAASTGNPYLRRLEDRKAHSMLDRIGARRTCLRRPAAAVSDLYFAGYRYSGYRAGRVGNSRRPQGRRSG